MSFAKPFFMFAAVAVLGVAMLGCGSGGPGPLDSDAQVDDLVEGIKSTLEGIAQDGQMGEAFGEVRGMTDELKTIDSEKGGSISKDLDALEALSTPDEIKAKAKEIASKL